MTRTLRHLGQSGTASTQAEQPLNAGACSVAIAAIFIRLCLSVNLLAFVGIDYDSVGGNPLVKFHPATYVAAFAAAWALFGGRLRGSGIARLFRDAPSLAAFIILIVFCIAWSVANLGISGASIYVETYLFPAMVMIALEAGSARQHRILGWSLLIFCLIQVGISVGESLTQTHLIPPHFGNALTGPVLEQSDEFRGAGLFDHPLTAAMVTVQATFLLLRMRASALVTATAFTVLVIGQLSFGGRTAIVVSTLMLSGGAIVLLLTGLATRRLNVGFLAAVIAALIILPPLMFGLTAVTDIGERVLTHFYLDDSAEVRTIQWNVLSWLNLHDVLFGVSPERLASLKYQIGLAAETTDIENFWLLIFLNLGAIAYVVFLVALGLFIMHVGRLGGSPIGWMLVIATVIIVSSSNSLGRKTPDLAYLGVFLAAIHGFVVRQGADSTKAAEVSDAAQEEPVANRRHFVTLRGTLLGAKP